MRRIHTQVHGTAPDGRPYRADDPELLTWVHTPEVYSFLAGHQIYARRRSRLTPAECDTYYAQVAPVAEALGAVEVPRNTREATRYLARVRSELHVTQAALEALGFLRGFGRTRRERLVVRLLTNAVPPRGSGSYRRSRPGPLLIGALHPGLWALPASPLAPVNLIAHLPGRYPFMGGIPDGLS
ncbi:hypothetical protein GCM10022403_072360 [Streptomyces coacervatus]|uniref:ER-bound oxygenase mpaB/mpaB'/Rubber oxygenase catalytic domain-containing protein n=1 Tax=Streptomyces coacervatus TaxID=647381 RepID=A0ABP7IWF1_9ACTN|nr:oxygenase MpaB family protein [Streptomyces coacervatus]MDF2269642.1 oxygenase MpaB family protein [Streptomyces coacervatus]